jgi:hypothetical protein
MLNAMMLIITFGFIVLLFRMLTEAKMKDEQDNQSPLQKHFQDKRKLKSPHH